MSRMSENVGASTSRNPTGIHGLVTGITLPYLTHLMKHEHRDDLGKVQIHHSQNPQQAEQHNITSILWPKLS
jgi:hypothetical protein